MLPYKSSAFALVDISLREKEMRAEKGKSLSLDAILTDVCVSLSEKIEDVQSSKRTAALAKCRKVYCFVSRMKTPCTFKRIAAMIGGRDHTTAIHHVNEVKGFLKVKDPEFMMVWDLYLENSKLFNRNDF